MTLKRKRIDDDLAELIEELSVVMGETETKVTNWILRSRLAPKTLPYKTRERLEKGLQYIEMLLEGKAEPHRAPVAQAA